MIGLGLRGLVGAGGKVLDAGRKAGMWAKDNPIKTTAAGLVGAAAVSGGPDTEQRMAEYAGTPSGEYGNLLYGRHETHRPGEAFDAYAEDDFIKTAFASAASYDEFSSILGQAGLDATRIFPKELYERLISDPELAAQFAQDRVSAHTADMEKDMQGFGEGWRERYQPDDWQRQRGSQYAMSLQQMGR